VKPRWKSVVFGGLVAVIVATMAGVPGRQRSGGRTDGDRVGRNSHMVSVKRLLDRYGHADPVGADVPGVFADANLQAVYDSLVAQGMWSLEDAFKAGVAIEEQDIADLKELIAISTQRDVTRVAKNLLRGSQRHLVAFTKLLEQ
jgi:hypothetical protein